MKRALVLYIPVIHNGYLNFFDKHKNKADTLYVLGSEFINEFSALHREIRAVSPETIKKFVEALGIFPSVNILRRASLKGLKEAEITAADEEISRKFVARYLPRAKVKFENVFLRWDEAKVKKENRVNSSRVSKKLFDRAMMKRAKQYAKSSSDWWRHVGAVVVKNGKVIIDARNRHLPSDHMPYIEGDPRGFIEAGKLGELTTSLHSEQAAVAEAARRGVSLLGASIYVTAFPCPVCAKLIAYSGIEKCFFAEGSASLDGERVLKTKGVQIILVK